MEEISLTNKRKRSVLLSFAPLFLALIVIANDLTVQYYHIPPGSECKDYVIYDVYGVLKDTDISKDPCYYTGLSVDDFRTLGKLETNKIIIITHNFYQGILTGIGTSDPASPIAPILHPISVFYLVKGITSKGEKYLAVTPNISSLSIPLNGKEIVLLVCSENIDKIATGLASMGAKIVVVSNTPSLTPEQAISLVKLSVQDNSTSLCSSPFFYCYGGEKT